MGTYGSARFASRGDLARARLVGDWTPGTMPDGLLLGWWRESRYDFEPITYSGDLHQLIIGGTGGGKLMTALGPMLLGSSLENSAVVAIDPKGELARLAGPVFQKPFADRPSVFLLDPYDLTKTGKTSVLNFLSDLTPENPRYISDARALAHAMVTDSGSDNTHWDTAARNLLTGILLHVAMDPLEKQRDMLRVRELATLPWAEPKVQAAPEPTSFELRGKRSGKGKAKQADDKPAELPFKRETLSALCRRYQDSPSAERANGAIRRAFSGMLNREERERSGIISTLERETVWLEEPKMARVLRGPSLDMEQAALGANKYFIALPPEYLHDQRQWMRLCITAFGLAFKRHIPEDDQHGARHWRHIIIDEFPALGDMPDIMRDIAVSRGYAVKYHLAIQDIPQMRHLYREGWESFINNSFQRVFAVNDVSTVEYISNMLGETTVESRGGSDTDSQTRTSTYGTSDGTSAGYSRQPFHLFGTHTSGTTGGSSQSTSHGSTISQTLSFNEVQRRLMTQDEVRRMDEGEQIILMRGSVGGILSWRPTCTQIFPSLPNFSLKDVMGTVGRKPTSEAERARFMAWRERPRVMAPEPPPPLREAPAVIALPAPESAPPDWRLIVGLSSLALAFLAAWLS